MSMSIHVRDVVKVVGRSQSKYDPGATGDEVLGILVFMKMVLAEAVLLRTKL